jgi:phosphate transport system substrate-binding protein
MAQRSGPPPIVFILGALLLAGGGYWYFVMQKPAANSPPSGTTTGTAPKSVPAGTKIRINGSTSMITINENLKKGFEKQFSGTNVTVSSGGSDSGIKDLLDSKIELAAISRPLTPQEQSKGLVAVSIATDKIAVVVGKINPFSSSLNSQQVAGIFQGKIKNWSEVGGSPAPIQVVNRPEKSGTNKSFQELVLKGAKFGTTSNITTLPNDETTGLLRALGNNGIGYATYSQVANQQTVRSLPIDGTTPDNANYPYQRSLFYVYKNPPNPAAQAFMDYATSAEGQKAINGQN